MNSTIKDVLEFINENDVKFIRLGFCDPFGMHKNISIMANELADAFKNGVVLKDSAIKCFDAGQPLLYPDPTTLTVLPWRPGPGRVVRFYCYIKDVNENACFADSRLILKNVLQDFESRGLRCKIGTDCEFYLFKNDENGEPTYNTLDFGGYCDIAPLDKGENIRREICLNLEEMGLQPMVSHHEKGPGQNEIDFKYSDALNAADNFLTFKSVVKAISARNGLYASFMPKPLKDEAGSGLRLNISITGTVKDDFINQANSFVAGIIKKSVQITMFLNPTVNSYDRLDTHGIPSVAGHEDSGANPFVRIVEKNSDKMLIELRSPDCTINPYLAFALVLSAGLYGIQNRLALTDVKGESALPQSLQEAAELGRKSTFVKSIVGEKLLDAIAHEKSLQYKNYNDAKDKDGYIAKKYFSLY